ncbi:HtaA domain-containing protein [Streptomyces apocyni]|uniref:HtaA domain-containing protein n=1 Tax=Streptomyces apocyni TaxID=2654677 RepID=UPI0012EA6325|nr:HtaA domain-containing protein [Streptomyces apocyni]
MLSWTSAARATAMAGLTALVAVLLPAATAQAQDRTVQGGRLDWGIKSSFQSYVTGPVAQGRSTLQGGAATVGGTQFRFHSASGTYDPANGSLRAAFSGGVRFTGHTKPDGSHELDLTVSRPTVRIAGGSGTLYADMASKDKGSGKVTSTAEVPLASLSLSGVDMRGGTGPIALNNLPATLTAQGAKAFAGYYAAGTALDPVSLSVDLAAAPTATKDPAKDPADERTEEPTKEPSTKPSKKAEAGRIEDAAVDWGVRRTFREYVTGAIAQGKWTLSGGAQDGGALFRFPKGSGTYDAKKRTLDADFTGSVRFTGAHDLDLALSKVAVTVEDGKGSLSADVASADFTQRKTPLITFTVKDSDLAPQDGLVTVTEAPAKLTADGAKAFGSMYKAGTEMDPVSLAIALTKDAELPALPDLGSSAAPTTATPDPTATATPTATDATTPAASSSSSSPAVPLGIGAGVLLAAAAAVAFAVVRKRRTAPSPDHP